MNQDTLLQEQDPAHTPEAHSLQSQFVQKCRLAITMEKIEKFFSVRTGPMTQMLFESIMLGYVPGLIGAERKLREELGVDQPISTMYRNDVNGPRKVLDAIIEEWRFTQSRMSSSEQPSLEPTLRTLVNLMGLYLEVLKAMKLWALLEYDQRQIFKRMYPGRAALWELFPDHSFDAYAIIKAFRDRNQDIFAASDSATVFSKMEEIFTSDIRLMNDVRGSFRTPRMGAKPIRK